MAMARFANSPYALPRMINFGIIGTDLPGHETLSDDEVSTLAQYFKSLRSKKSRQNHETEAFPLSMMFTAAALIPSFLFSAIGFMAFSYGRKLQLWKPLSLGLILMIYPYFCPGPVWLWVLGIVFTIVLWFHHDE